MLAATKLPTLGLGEAFRHCGRLGGSTKKGAPSPTARLVNAAPLVETLARQIAGTFGLAHTEIDRLGGLLSTLGGHAQG